MLVSQKARSEKGKESKIVDWEEAPRKTQKSNTITKKKKRLLTIPNTRSSERNQQQNKTTQFQKKKTQKTYIKRTHIIQKQHQPQTLQKHEL